LVIKYDFESEVAPPTYSPEVALVVNVSALGVDGAESILSILRQAKE
jgi:hypothetical protein